MMNEQFSGKLVTIPKNTNYASDFKDSLARFRFFANLP
jgi:hypothetical protein